MLIKEIYDIKDRFSKFAETCNNQQEFFSKSQSYYRWLDENAKAVQHSDTVVYAHLQSIQLWLIHKLIYWTTTNNISIKNFSTSWNKQMVEQALIFRDRWIKIPYRERKEKDSTYFDERTALFNKIKDCSDFASMVGCYSAMESLGDFNLEEMGKKLVAAAYGERRKQEKVDSIQKKSVPRLTVNGDVLLVPLNTVFFNNQTKEEMTYDECLERGLDLTSLCNTKHIKDHPNDSKQTLPFNFVDEQQQDTDFRKFYYNIALKNAIDKKKPLQKKIDSGDFEAEDDVKLSYYNSLPSPDYDFMEMYLDKRFNDTNTTGEPMEIDFDAFMNNEIEINGDSVNENNTKLSEFIENIINKETDESKIILIHKFVKDNYPTNMHNKMIETANKMYVDKQNATTAEATVV